MNLRSSLASVGYAALLALVAFQSSQAGDAVWTATSGSFPTNANPSWLFYGEPTNSVTLAAGILRLETSPAFARATYFQEFYALSVPTNLVIEARMRFVNGSSTTPARSAAGVYFYPQKGVANYLWIGQDEIFVNAGTRFQKGETAAVDTDN